MKAHTQEFKNKIKQFGRELDSKITYTLNNEEVVLGNENLNAITPHYEGDILKSVMKQLDIDSNVNIPVGTEVNYKFGVKTRSGKNIYDNNSTAKYKGSPNIKEEAINTGKKLIWNSSTSSTWAMAVYVIKDVSNDIGKRVRFKANINASGSNIGQYYIGLCNGDGSNRLSKASSTISGTTIGFDIPELSGQQKYLCLALYVNTTGTVVQNDYVDFTNVILTIDNSDMTYEDYGMYDYLDYGNYIVYSTEKQEDTRSYKIVCYDKMLYAMKDYEKIENKNLWNESTQTFQNQSRFNVLKDNDNNWTFTIIGSNGYAFAISKITLQAGTYTASANVDNGSFVLLKNNATISNTFTLTEETEITFRVYKNGVVGDIIKLSNVQIEEGNTATNYAPYFTYPITLKNYLWNICSKIGLDFKNTNFVNYDKEITNELYLDSNGNSLGYTYRDVLDEIAGATASTICINEDDELEVRYINATDGNNIYADSENLASVMQENAQMTKTGTGRECTMTKTSNGSASPRIQFDNDFFEVNTTYYISFKIKGNWSKFQFGTWINNSQTQLVDNITPTNEWQTITCHFTYPSTKYTSDRIYFRNNDSYVLIGQTLTITDFMISKVDVPYEPYGADLINEEYLKDINVNFGEKYGPVNSVVFSRSAESDNIYRQDTTSITNNGLTEIKIIDNQILNGNNRDDFIDGVFNQLNGFEYYANDFSSTGVAYYDLCDRYNVKVDDNYYSCIMMNDELDITQGLEEQVHTDIPEKSETDYKKADSTDRRINETWIIANKQEGYIEALTSRTTALEENNDAIITQINDLVQTADGITNTFTEAGGNNIFRNTGLWFESDDNNNPYEFWTGLVVKQKEDKASNLSGIVLQNNTLTQEQVVANGYYTISFKYKRLLATATLSVFINGVEYQLTDSDEINKVIEYEKVLEVQAQHITLDFVCNMNGGFEIYDLMVNSGQQKLAYSQNQNETTTDTVNISKGITITSSDTDVKFKADADGIRTLDSSNNELTKFTDEGMTTKSAIIEDKSQIVGTLWQEVDGQTWITRL